MKNRMNIREQLINNGVKNLKEFGYPDCNSENIMEHMILKTFFISMLQENLGKNKEIDIVINELLKDLNKGDDEEN